MSEETLNPQEIVEIPQTKSEIVDRLEQLLAEEVSDIKERVDALKQAFYRIHNAEHEAAVANADQESGEQEETVEDAEETRFKNLLAKYKELRAQELERQQQQREQNAMQKQNIIDQMRALAQSETADISGEMEHFHQLQQQWREIGAVDPSLEGDLQKQYEQYQNQFYDLLTINRELRDYDFKKNLEAKTLLCEKAESLADRDDIVPAFRDLLSYQEEWKNIGPVAREYREEIWNRFRAAATVIFKKHQDYFAQLHEREQHNLELKQILCDRLQAIGIDQLNTAKLWDEATAQVTAIQEEWRTIGFAPKKDNQRIYDQYRKLCDDFFNARNAFYKNVHDQLTTNLQRKQQLVERAQKLKDSTDWNKTSQVLKDLQQEWKNIGAAPRKVSNELWSQFREACDHFFSQKQAATADQRAEETKNLEEKKAILEKIENLEIGERNATLKSLRQLMGQFQNIGFVPFREKDKLYKRFKAATDKIFDQLQVEESNRRLDTFNKNIEEESEDQLLNQRRRLLRQYDDLKAQIATSENNICFFTAKSNKTNNMITSMQKNIENQKKQLAEIERKINLIDQKLQ